MSARPSSKPEWTEAELRQLAESTGVSVRSDPPTRRAASSDFGHLAVGAPVAVASPREAGECGRVLAYAHERGLPLTVRGRGYSQSGQSLAPEGTLTLETSRMDALGPVDTAARQVECAAGARWRELTLQTLRHGLIPNVLPLNLDMSVGGLLCAGGVGANSYRHGPVVANVTALEVATCTGELVRCGADEQPELFAAMLGGLGHVAVITRATLALRPAATSVRTFHLLYETVEAWLEDCRMLQGRGGADHLEGFCWASAKGLRSGPHGTRPFMHWQYGLQASFEYQGAPPEASHALRGTRPWKVLGHLDLDFAAFTFRYQPRFDGMHASGAWEQAHPWLECFLSPEELPRVLPEALDLLPPSLGDGHRLTWVARSNGPSSLRLPSDLSLCFALLPTGVPTHELPGALRALVGAHRLLIDAGGKRYLSGWLGEMDRSAWERHHGERFEAWEGARRRFDPKALLRSVLLPAHCRSASVS